jgi:putative oxidoreductase
MKRWIVGTPITEVVPSVGLLIFRVVFGGFMLVGHGWAKLMKFGALSESFPDPLGIGSTVSLAGAVTSEVVFAALVLVGVATRAAVLPLIFTMAVAAFAVHGSGPWFLPAEGAKEPALLYLAAYAVLICTGAGRYSVDYRLGAADTAEGPTST